MDAADIVKDSFRQHISNFTGASFHIRKNVEIMKSGLDHYSCNFCFVGSELSSSDKDFIKDKLNTDAIIFSKHNIKDDLSDFKKNYYLGKYPFMLRQEVPDFYKAPNYDDLEILSVEEYPMIIEDYIKIFSESRGMEKDVIKKSFSIERLKNNNHFFVAYLSDNPAGIFYAISYGENAFVMETFIKDQYKNSGLLTAMAKAAKEYALKKNMINFYAIPTSEFSVKVMGEQGYKVIGSYHMWRKFNDIII
jgi:hypothetical protein